MHAGATLENQERGNSSRDADTSSLWARLANGTAERILFTRCLAKRMLLVGPVDASQGLRDDYGNAGFCCFPVGFTGLGRQAEEPCYSTILRAVSENAVLGNFMIPPRMEGYKFIVGLRMICVLEIVILAINASDLDPSFTVRRGASINLAKGGKIDS